MLKGNPGDGPEREAKMKARKVLVIDDDKKFLSEIEETLIMGGYNPVLVSDAFSAIDTVIQNKPDIILMELRIPHKSGFELTYAINQAFESRRVPIIAMSSFFKDEFSWLLNFCGIKKWLKKPFHPLNVFWAIENEIEEGNQCDRKRSLAVIEGIA